MNQKMPVDATPYLDHGFVKLLEVMGSDESIEAAARVSYSGVDPTRKKSDTRNLLRFLMRYEHTSPFEMAEVKFILRVPIFVMRQLVRHRTASLNEYSGRYSVMTEDCYVPEASRICKQSTTNKQGSGEAFSAAEQYMIQAKIERDQEGSVHLYKDLIDDDMTRELARGVLPVSNYTELYWKCDLNNFFRFLRLRLDRHAQQEIRELAQLMYDQVKPHFPISCDAFEDYQLNAERFSAPEMQILRDLAENYKAATSLNEVINACDTLTEREKVDMRRKLNLITK